MNKKQVLKNISESEKCGDFSSHVIPIHSAFSKKVKPNYVYIRRNLLRKAYEKVCRAFAFSLTPIASKICKLEIKGLINMSGIDSAVITCNHISRIDNMDIRKAVKGHKLYVTVGEFNNKKFLLGDILRGSGILPFSDGVTNVKLFRAISTLLKENNYVLFYPEESLWWHYEKPRPMKEGAFFCSAKNNVPIIPMFFTFEERKCCYRGGIHKKRFILNILEPIFPKTNCLLKENVQYLKETNFKRFKDEYEEFYGKSLVYSCETRS